MSAAEKQSFTEAGLRHELTAEEQAQVQAYLAIHPEAAGTVEEDIALNQILRQLPAKPVSSNFTHQVLQAVTREPQLAQPRLRLRFRLWPRIRRFLPKAALAGVFIGAGLISYRQYQIHTRKELAQNVAKVSSVTTLVSVDVLKDYDAINRLNPAPIKVDEELFMALKQ